MPARATRTTFFSILSAIAAAIIASSGGVFAAGVVVGSGSGCGQTASTSDADAGDAMQPAAPDASTPTCFYDLPDGAPRTCPADGKTRCLSADGCNFCVCRLGPGGAPPMFSVCTGQPCPRP